MFCLQYCHPKVFEKFTTEERRAYHINSNSDDLNPDNFADVTFRIICKSYFRILSKNGDNITAECKLCTESKILQTSRNQSYSFTRHLRVRISVKRHMKIFLIKQFFFLLIHNFCCLIDGTHRSISTIFRWTSTGQTREIGKNGEQIRKQFTETNELRLCVWPFHAIEEENRPEPVQSTHSVRQILPSSGHQWWQPDGWMSNMLSCTYREFDTERDTTEPLESMRIFHFWSFKLHFFFKFCSINLHKFGCFQL